MSIGLNTFASSKLVFRCPHKIKVSLISSSLHTVLAYISHKEGDLKLAKDHFENQKIMKNSITKWWIENFDFINSRSKEFMNDYVKVLQSLGLPDQ